MKKYCPKHKHWQEDGGDPCPDCNRRAVWEIHADGYYRRNFRQADYATVTNTITAAATGTVYYNATE